MKKIRSLSVILAVTLALAAAGCSDTAPSTTNETSKETTATVSEETTSEVTTVEESEESEETEEESETTVAQHDFDTEYFKAASDSSGDIEDEELQKIAKEYEDDGYQIDSLPSLSVWFAYEYPLYEGEPDIDNIYAYLYRGFQAYKIEDGTQYAYEYVMATEDILENDLGFTKKSEDGDLITYDTPDTGAYRIYSYDSYVFDRSTGILKASQEMYVGEGVG